MRLTPIIALVDDATLAAIQQAADDVATLKSAAAVQHMCELNGWTIQALIAGQTLMHGLDAAMEVTS